MSLCSASWRALFVSKESKYAVKKKADSQVYVTQSQIFRARLRAKGQEMSIAYKNWKQKYREKYDHHMRRMEQNRFIRRHIFENWEGVLFSLEENRGVQAAAGAWLGTKRRVKRVIVSASGGLEKMKRELEKAKTKATPGFILRKKKHRAAFKIQYCWRAYKSRNIARKLRTDVLRRRRVLHAAWKIQSLYHLKKVPHIIESLVASQYDRVYDKFVCTEFYYNTINGKSSWDAPFGVELPISTKGMYANEQVLENIRPRIEDL